MKNKAIIAQDTDGNLKESFMYEIKRLMDEYGILSISNGFIGYKDGKFAVEGVNFDCKANSNLIGMYCETTKDDKS